MPSIRASIQRLLREAMDACGRLDLDWADKQVALWAEAEDLAGARCFSLRQLLPS